MSHFPQRQCKKAREVGFKYWSCKKKLCCDKMTGQGLSWPSVTGLGFAAASMFWKLADGEGLPRQLMVPWLCSGQERPNQDVVIWADGQRTTI